MTTRLLDLIARKDSLTKKEEVGMGNEPRTFEDQKTGQMVTQVDVPPNLVEDIIKQLNTHAEHSNKLMTLTAQLVALEKAQLVAFDDMEAAAKRINKAVADTVKKMKLERQKRWTYNIQLKCMESRTAPTYGKEETL